MINTNCTTEQQVRNLHKLKMSLIRRCWPNTDWSQAGERILNEDLKLYRESKKLKINVDKGVK